MGFMPISVEISEAEERLVINRRFYVVNTSPNNIPLNLPAFYLKDCNMASINRYLLQGGVLYWIKALDLFPVAEKHELDYYCPAALSNTSFTHWFRLRFSRLA
jgi:hypothetical protein